MKNILILLILFSNFCFAQKPNNFSLELKGNTFTGLGDNWIADGTKTFTGIGFGFSGVVYKNFGVGLEYNTGYSEVKDISVFGDLYSPKLQTIDYFALYRYDINPKASIEGNIGGANLFLKSYSNYRSNYFSENGKAFLLGGKALYSITKNNKLYVFASGRLYFFNTDIEMGDEEIEKYYSKATLLNFSLGLRIYF